MDKAKSVDVMKEIAERVHVYERAAPIVQLLFKGATLKYAAVNQTTLWRIKTLSSKEPMTISWIEAFEPGSVFYDVGANVGMFSIFAAVHRNARVFAFEPEAQNYALLNQNTLLNKVQERITAFNVALSDELKVDYLFLSEMAAGGSCHSFGADVGFDLKSKEADFRQGAIAMPLDQLVALGALPPPRYLKIDVDGFEHLVCAGAKQIFATDSLKEICIELNPALPDHRDVMAQLSACGFAYDQAEAEKAARKDGFFQGVGEFFFRRA